MKAFIRHMSACIRRTAFVGMLSAALAAGLGSCATGSKTTTAKKTTTTTKKTTSGTTSKTTTNSGSSSSSTASAKVGATFTGKASYYADKFEGKSTASGEPYKASKLTGAHRTLPFGTVVRVTNTSNGKSVDIKINDRGPFAEGRVVDLSKAAAQKIDMIKAGVVSVSVKVISVP